MTSTVTNQTGCRLTAEKGKELTIEFVNVHKQGGGSDCGLFALAFITSVCNGEDPAKCISDQAAMQNHLVKCVEKGCLLSLPLPIESLENLIQECQSIVFVG